MTKRAKSHWSHVVLVCGKCSKKVGKRFGEDEDQALAKALRRAGGKGRRAAVGVIETRCLKLCPKNAVTVVDSRAPGEWLVVSPDEPLADLTEKLGLTPAA